MTKNFGKILIIVGLFLIFSRAAIYNRVVDVTSI